MSIGNDSELFVGVVTEDDDELGLLELTEANEVEVCDVRWAVKDLENDDSVVAKAADDRRKHRKRSLAWSCGLIIVLIAFDIQSGFLSGNICVLIFCLFEQDD